VRMPNLGISALDAVDLISYLQSETSRIVEGARDVPAAANQDSANKGHHHEHHHQQ